MIYLVEDDNSIRELVAYTLHSAGFQAEGFEKPSAFWHACETKLPDLVLLDLMLPEEDGISILKKLRQAPHTKKLPIILLTAKSSEYDKIMGLDSGADDYVAKPFSMMELLARVKALLRRTERNEAEVVYSMGSLSVNQTRHEVRVDGAEVTLTLKEFELLCLLMENKGRVLTRDQLLNSIWGYGFDGENRTVDVHIRTLRQKLGKCGEYIETVRGVGYKIGGNL
ncbi:MAG: response regulator transcription factor [Anaerotignum sp.]|nr:response regulator transcription factor [Anaerotignum sp.]MDY3927190.1 response regulator transcription factor [Anaerotignum sp.]